MRNLAIVSHSLKKFEFDIPLSATAWDTSSNCIICAFGPSKSDHVIQLTKQAFRDGLPSEASLIASWDAPCPLADLQNDEIVDLHYFSHSETACLVLAGGDIIVVREKPVSGQEKIEIVGSVDVGISAAKWSPDEELLAVATRASTLLYMTVDYENVSSITLSPDDVKLSKQVSVGWGKAETQFKGKRAKALRDPTVPEKVDEGELSPLDRRNVTLSWRGDGAFVAINSIVGNSRRTIRILSREGVLESVAEATDGLEGALSWRPAGNLLAGVQRLKNELKVVFFERNGLRHGDLALRVTEDDMRAWAKAVDLDWNIDSSVLAVKFQDRVQLWTMGNYHYYLKQEIFVKSVERNPIPVCLSWHHEEALRICLFAFNDQNFSSEENTAADLPAIPESYMHTLRLVFDTNRGSAVLPHDFGFQAVIDGCTLKLTPLRRANVPPPMALHEVHLQEPIIDVAFNAQCSRIAVLHRRRLCLLKLEPESSVAPQLAGYLDLPDTEKKRPLQICSRAEDDIYVLTSDFDRGVVELLDVRQSRFTILPTSEVMRLFSSIGFSTLCFESMSTVSMIGAQNTTNGNALPDEAQNMEPLNTFPAPCPWVAVSRGQQDIAFGLTSTGSLYANLQRVAANCTSFLVTKSHLIYTTTQHLLKFVHLETALELVVPPDQPDADERCRSIERGALLVNVMPSTFSLTLQMPRGNLETIYPRALVLSAIRRYIHEKNYKKAFMACRSQRVDMNILYDYDAVQFLANIEQIVKQWSKPEYIDLFLSALNEDDVTQTLYKETHPIATANGESMLETQVNIEVSSVLSLTTMKVNTICDAFLSVLTSRYSTHLQNVITAHVCKKPPDIVAGLTVAADLKKTDDDLADTAVEHICFLVDVNKVYDEALGLYNLDLALLVAQQSQKDPREYMPYLHELQEMPTMRKQFTIDHNLGRYTKALRHLHTMTLFDELTAYVQKHELYNYALDLYKYDRQRQPIILRLFGEFLESRNRFKEAAIVFESLADYQAACSCYKGANMWRECLSCALLVPLPTDEVHSLAEMLCEGQVEAKDHYSAALIQRDYLNDITTAAQHFCKAYDFAEAIRLVSLNKQPQLLQSVVDPGLMEIAGSVTEILADCKSQLEAQVPRLRELRKIKSQDPLAFFEGALNADIPDNVSLAPTDATTSAGTFLTRYTNRTGTINTQTSRKTSKNRRREERKRARGKKGSVYEEEYLVNSIARLIDRINEMNGDVSKLVQGLLRRSMREQAEAVERTMVEVINACRGCIEEVFEVDKNAGADKEKSNDAEGTTRPLGGDGVLWDSFEEARKVKEPPVIKSFASSALLAN